MYNIVCNPVTTADITMRNNTTGVKRFRSFLILSSWARKGWALQL